MEFDTIAAEADEQTTSADTVDTPAGIDHDEDNPYQDAPNASIRAEALVSFDRIVDFGFVGSITDRQNLRGRDGYPDSFVLTLENPTLEHGQVWKATDEESSSKDYKIVGEETVNEEAEKNEDGEWEDVGMSVPGGDRFYSEQIDDFDTEHIKLWLNGGTAQHIARVLDTIGGEAAYHLDGDRQNETTIGDFDGLMPGLIEFPPNYGSGSYDPRGDDPYPRVARTPDLRQDMIDQPGVLLMKYNDDDYQESHVARIEGEDRVWLDQLRVDDEAAAPPRHGTALEWSDDDRTTTTDETQTNTKAPDTSSDDGNTFDLETSSTTTYEDLHDQWQTFVDEVVGADMDPTDDDFDDWEETVEGARDEKYLPEVDPDTLADIIESRL